MLLKTIFVSAAFAASATAAQPVVGLVTASGHSTLNHSQVWGNATVFDGSKIDTTDASSEATLNNGVRMQLGSASRANVSEKRLELWKGVGQASTPESFKIDAAAFAIRSSGNTGRVRVGLVDGKVDVTTIAGLANVINTANGETVASIAAGQRRSFAMQVGGGTVSHSGCLLYKDNHYILQDQSTQEVFEIKGNGLGSNMSNQVAITGTVVAGARSAVAPANSIINASSVVLQQQGGCLSVAAALGAYAEVATAPGGETSPATPAPGAKTTKTEKRRTQK
jgi:hypothetical protein